MSANDSTVKRNYLHRWRRLIEEYEAVREGRSETFCNVGSFYKHHGTSSQTLRKYYNRYRATGLESDLLPRIRGPKVRQRSEAQNNAAREAVFKVLHAPPLEFGFNRTTWKIVELQQALKTTGLTLSKRDLRSIIRKAGFRWLKAKKVLTSKDPDYREKLDKIHLVLATLGRDEGFFSIDEFGPFAITQRGGRRLVRAPDDATIPQRQKSKGLLIVTAALELSTNQVIHFYSEKKNSTEMIKLIDTLLEKHRHLSQLYLSWDAASWHISKPLTDRISANNTMAFVTGSTRLEVVPLPAGAQFLNVIESVFSGMARAVIHNSDYASVEEAKSAIDRHFLNRNEYFRAHPKRAGNRIWGEERQGSKFSEGRNYKDPRYR